MMTYEKPWAEFIKFEAEHIMNDLDLPIGPSIDEGVEDDW